MRRVCCVCKKLFGIKPPLDDDSETHGFCPDCFELEIAKVRTFHKEWKKNQEIEGVSV